MSCGGSAVKNSIKKIVDNASQDDVLEEHLVDLIVNNNELKLSMLKYLQFGVDEMCLGETASLDDSDLAKDQKQKKNRHRRRIR
mmetsp:Transcript_863/g.1114  ORF Transcript_863/g.1114 Transcript_863/m.1114 type:complete len:84 (-) Transcript_863:26-277(-)